MPHNTHYKTLAEAIHDDYDFSLLEIFSQAWQSFKKHQGKIFKLSLLITFLTMLSNIVTLTTEYLTTSPMIYWAIQIINYIFYSCIIVSVINIFIKLTQDESIMISKDLWQFTKMWQLILILSITMLIILVIGFKLFILPGIYFYIAYSLVYWIANIYPTASFWQILEASRKIVTRHWFKFFFIGLILSAILYIFTKIVLIIAISGLYLAVILTQSLIVSIILIAIVLFFTLLFISFLGFSLYALSLTMIFNHIFHKQSNEALD